MGKDTGFPALAMVLLAAGGSQVMEPFEKKKDSRTHPAEDYPQAYGAMMIAVAMVILALVLWRN
jgi:hypothetical protein